MVELAAYVISLCSLLIEHSLHLLKAFIGKTAAGEKEKTLFINFVYHFVSNSRENERKRAAKAAALEHISAKTVSFVVDSSSPNGIESFPFHSSRKQCEELCRIDFGKFASADKLFDEPIVQFHNSASSAIYCFVSAVCFSSFLQYLSLLSSAAERAKQRAGKSGQCLMLINPLPDCLFLA